jgi:uncharacterized protein DUF6364
MAYIISINRRMVIMSKGKINITLDKDLIEYAKIYAEEQRTSVSEIFTQFILGLKRTRESDPTELILADPDFKMSLLETISRIRSGKVKWSNYKEIF